MKIIPVINLITAQCASFDAVEPAQSLEALPDSEITSSKKYAFVYQSDDDSPGFETMHATQQYNERFSVIIACRNIDIDTSAEPLEDLKTELRDGIVNQELTGYAPISWVSGRILATSKRLVWWVETFETFKIT